MKLSRLRATLASLTALVTASALASSPAAALAPPPAAPNSAVFVILPGGTATAATVAMQMPGGVPIPIGTLNPTTGKFLPAGLGSLATLSSLSGLDGSGVSVTANSGAGSTTLAYFAAIARSAVQPGAPVDTNTVMAAGSGNTPLSETKRAGLSLTPFDKGAVGDGATDDSTALNALGALGFGSLSGTRSTIFKSTFGFGNLPGSLWTGPGRILRSDGGLTAPLTSQAKSYPSSLGTSGNPLAAFNGDLSAVGIAHQHTITGAATLGQPLTGYVENPESVGEYNATYNSSGYNASLLGNGGRTGTAHQFLRLDQAGQGDLTGIFCTGAVNAVLPNAQSYLATPALECIGGGLVAFKDKSYLEWLGDLNLSDNGYAIAASTLVGNLTRTNAIEDVGQNWTGIRLQSRGTKPIDAFASFTGLTLHAIDLTGAVMADYSLAGFSLTNGGSGYTGSAGGLAGYFSGQTFTLTTAPTSGVLQAGQLLYANGQTALITLGSLASGTANTAGAVYNINVAQTLGSSSTPTTMTAIGDKPTIASGTYETPTQIQVLTVDVNGAILTYQIVNAGMYTAAAAVSPTYATVSLAGGTGTGATASATFVKGTAMALPAGGCFRTGSTQNNFPNSILMSDTSTECFFAGGISIGGQNTNNALAGASDVAIGLGNLTTASAIAILMGTNAYDDAQNNSLFFSSGYFTSAAKGSSQDEWKILRATTAASTACKRLSTNNNASITSTNSHLVTAGSAHALTMRVTAIDRTNGDTATWDPFYGTISRTPSGTTATYAGAATAASAPTRSTGAGSSASITIAADNSVSGSPVLSATFCPPSSNADVWNVSLDLYSLKTAL